MRLTRRVTFSSGHRYWLDDLSEKENRGLFGQWASPYNHGHNYALDVTVQGSIDPQTGMVVNIKDIDTIVRERIVSQFHLKSLNDEVPYFRTHPPSLENIAKYVWGELAGTAAVLGEDARVTICALRLYETHDLFVEFSGDGMTLTRGYEFSASHRLQIDELSEADNRELFGKCNNPSGHGHNYEIEVTVSAPVDERTGMMADLMEIDRVVNGEVVERYDHKHLNEDLPEFSGVNPTTEVVTSMIWKRLQGKLPAKLEKVTVRETARSSFEYSGEDE